MTLLFVSLLRYIGFFLPRNMGFVHVTFKDKEVRQELPLSIVLLYYLMYMQN